MDLHTAVSQDRIFDIQSEIEKGADINAHDKYGRTHLWLAAMNGHLDACTVLVTRGANAMEPGLLELAVDQGHTKIVELLWPHCDLKISYHHLENAIAFGFHEIADCLVKGEILKDGHSQDTGIIEERFIFVRRSESLQLHLTFFNYALVLAAKADRNSGIRLVNLLLEGDEPLADVNCMIKIDGDFETPLTCAAGKGNLEILAILIQHPDIDLTLCGKYGWPAFLHLVMTLDSTSSRKSWFIAHMLRKNGFPDSCLVGSTGTDWETVYKNLIQQEDDELVGEVFNLVRGNVTDTPIIPLLIRTNQACKAEWILNRNIAYASEPSPSLLGRLGRFSSSGGNRDTKWDMGSDAPGLSPVVSFSFAKQFFYPANEILPTNVAEEALKGLSMSMISRSLLEHWADKGFAKRLLWSALQSQVWMDEAFELLLSYPYIDLDELFLRRQCPCIGEARTCSTDLPEDFSSILGSPMSQRQEFNDHREKEEVSPLAWAVIKQNHQLVDVLLSTSGFNVNSQDNGKRTPLMHTIIANDPYIVERLLRVSSINLNLPDINGRTAAFYAAGLGNVHILHMLVETQKVDFSIHDFNGETVYQLAERTGKKCCSCTCI
ncbi:uncharacterized protein N7483_001857 [Penicillium malachiteum]|uniref:uncharacterized protein n=1 Tax=Penicillium malachiteum TaxID=1324776 RepID=UPI0025471FCA|nr:uncharacterized protein N7483_001857 [Penicillium malachiteum]KAJ5736732.1 hypothetical protein N7483_001857 [Penicillium malachiteum]